METNRPPAAEVEAGVAEVEVAAGGAVVLKVRNDATRTWRRAKMTWTRYAQPAVARPPGDPAAPAVLVG